MGLIYLRRRLVEQLGRPVASGHLGRPCRLFQGFVDQGLVGFFALCGQTPELSEEPGRNANGDELFGISGFRTANAVRAF